MAKKKCLYCGVQTSIDNERCPGCGAMQFDQSMPAPAPYTPPAQTVTQTTTSSIPTRQFHGRPVMRRKRKNLFVGIAIVVVIIIIASSIIPNAVGRWPEISSYTFIQKSEAAGYIVLEEDAYDGWAYWAGAHYAPGFTPSGGKGAQLTPGEKVTLEATAIYVIDFTSDITLNNANIEYNAFVDKVKTIGGSSKSGSGTGFGKDHQYQINTSGQYFGVAIRVGLINLYIGPDEEVGRDHYCPVAHKADIVKFINSLGFKI